MPVFTKNNNSILIPSVEIKENQKVTILENHPTEYSEINVSFEETYLSQDAFSDKNGLRPYPWGQEIFGGKPEFLCDNAISRTGEWSFQITGKEKADYGALAVPDLEFKPKVTAGRFYYLSFWINYTIKEGQGIRLIQQFFREKDLKTEKEGEVIYPSYACYGPWINGTSNGEWIQYGLLVKAPNDSVLGDPVISLSETGKVNVDDAFFGEVKIN